MTIATQEHPQEPTDSACCSCISRSPQTGTDLVQSRSVAVIHNSPFRSTERDQTAGKFLVQLAPLQVYNHLFLKVSRGGGLCSDSLWCAQVSGQSDPDLQRYLSHTHTQKLYMKCKCVLKSLLSIQRLKRVSYISSEPV